jgi:hypothetical protein
MNNNQRHSFTLTPEQSARWVVQVLL